MKILTLFLFIFLLVNQEIYAGFNGPSETKEILKTVQQVLAADDMTTCTLEGNVIKHLEKNRFTFKDQSGEVVVDIAPYVFGGVDITPQDPIKLVGEVKGKRKQDLHIKVRYIEKLK